MEITLGILIPFIGTIIGTSMVFFMKNTLNKNLEKMLLGLASGVMIAASIWSLIMPSIEMAMSQNVIEWMPATIGFILGIAFLILTDRLISKLETKLNLNRKNENYKNNLMLFLAVTLHNIPEGMAVGVAFAGAISENASMAMLGAMSLAIGIGIQNIPEGAIISMPLKSSGISKYKAFLYGAISGIVEPVAAIVTLLLTSKITTVLPYLLAFAAGAMMYVVSDELIPKFQKGKNSKIGIIGLTAGFLIMMILDVALG